MLRRWLLHRAAKAYARKLPGRLLADYGGKKRYTFAQVRHAIAAAGLSPRYAILAYARYFPLGEFEDLRVETDILLDYDEARALFIANEPGSAASHDGDRPANPDVFA